MKDIAVYPGSFDPFTHGHYHIIGKGLKKFPHIYIVVAETPDKFYLFKPDERVEIVKEATEDISDRVTVDKLEDKLLVDYVEDVNASRIIRGWRDLLDLLYEFRRKIANKKLNPDIKTKLYRSDKEFRFLSSSLIREIILCEDGLERIKDYVHPFVYKKLEEKIKNI